MCLFMSSLKKAAWGGSHNGWKEDQKSFYSTFEFTKHFSWFIQHQGRALSSPFMDQLKLRNERVFQPYVARVGTPETWTQSFKSSNLCTENTGKVVTETKKTISGACLRIIVWCVKNFKSWIQVFVKEIQWITKNEYVDGMWVEKNGCISPNKEEY